MSEPRPPSHRDEDILERMFQSRRAEIAAQIAQAKQHAPTKEPFDLGRLAELCDLTGPLGQPLDPKTVGPELERQYYLSFPEVMSLAEFAQRRYAFQLND